MHISEGIITGVPAAAYTAGGLALMGWGAWAMKKFVAKFPDKKALIGMGGALIFFVSLIPLPAFTGTCSHPCGTPLVAILLGPSIAIALAGIALLHAGGVFRARRFQYLGGQRHDSRLVRFPGGMAHLSGGAEARACPCGSPAAPRA